VSDYDLVRRYADTGDEAAFELLVRRHATTVWAACRRILRDHQAAEDAFQVAFLALARRARTIHAPCVAGWLYRVAVRAALRLRTAPTRPTEDRAAPAADPDRDEAAAVVHEEVARLAEKYRLPVVLCDLAGLTHAEAAAHLGWPVGTVSGRLSVARCQLRARLTRRGVGAPAALAILAVPGLAAPGPVSDAQIRVAISTATGGTVPAAISSLTDGVLSAMRRTTITAPAVLACALVFAGVFTVAVIGQDSPRPVAKAEPPVNTPAAPGDQKPPLSLEAEAETIRAGTVGFEPGPLRELRVWLVAEKECAVVTDVGRSFRLVRNGNKATVTLALGEDKDAKGRLIVPSAEKLGIVRLRANEVARVHVDVGLQFLAVGCIDGGGVEELVVEYQVPESWAKRFNVTGGKITGTVRKISKKK
jgi:RNA polymerase sigma factor (sigma-70 family)